MFLQYTGIWNSGGGAAAPFHPADLASALLVLEADVDALDSGGSQATDTTNVEDWLDQTSNSFDASQTTVADQPVMDTGSIGGEDALFFNNNDDWMDFNNSGSPILPATGDWHMFFVVDHDNTDSTDSGLFSQGTTASTGGSLRIKTRAVGSTLRAQALFLNDGSEGNAILTEDYGSYTGDPFLLELKRSGSTFTISHNGGSNSFTDSGTRSIEQDGNLLGTNTNNATTYNNSPILHWQGWIGAVYIFDEELTGTDYTNVTDYINTKYGV
jgi:hypothetical protein